jgi:hypothetical protein
MTDALCDAVLQLVEHVASEMRRNDPERHRNQARIPSIGEAVATANYHVEAVHKILSALAPLSVLKGHVEYAGSDADARSEFKDTALAPMQTQLQSSLTEAAMNDAGLRRVFQNLVEVAFTGLFKHNRNMVCGIRDAEQWWRRDPGVASYVSFMYEIPIVFPRIEIEYRNEDHESNRPYSEEHWREAGDAWSLRLSMPLVAIMSDVEYARFWESRRQEGLRKVIRLDPCEFKVGRLFAHIRSLGIPENRRGGGVDAVGTCVLENELGYEIQLDDRRLEEFVVDMFWNPHEVENEPYHVHPEISHDEQDAQRAANGTGDNIRYLWGASPAGGGIGDFWPRVVARQLGYLDASMCGGHPQVARRSKLPYPRRLRWERT